MKVKVQSSKVGAFAIAQIAWVDVSGYLLNNNVKSHHRTLTSSGQIERRPSATQSTNTITTNATLHQSMSTINTIRRWRRRQIFQMRVDYDIFPTTEFVSVDRTFHHFFYHDGLFNQRPFFWCSLDRRDTVTELNNNSQHDSSRTPDHFSINSISHTTVLFIIYIIYPTILNKMKFYTHISRKLLATTWSSTADSTVIGYTIHL